ncbi:hypothetical protein EON65_07470 [archaeon]|nr:MAG: hypothetical protein EON65_07470 [archaeon]
MLMFVCVVGKITTIFNESLYYSRFVLPAPAPPLFDVDQAHNIHYEMPDTIPSVDHIIDMRQHCHHSWKANHDVYHVFQDEGVTNEPYAPSEGEEEVDSTPFCVLFEDLYVDFFRKHFGGGNGIEVYANSFIVLGIDDNCINAVADSASRSNTSSSASILPINELHSYNTRNLKVVKQIFDEVNIRNVVFAPKDSYYFALSKDGQGNKANFPVSTGYYDALETPTTTNSGKIDGSPPFESKSMNLNEYQAFHLYPPQYPNDTYSYESQSNSLYSKRPPLHYSQQGVQNLRRCHVTVFNSVVVAHFHSIMSIVKFFNHPVRVAGDRNEAVLQEKYKEEFDYKAGLDVEVFCDHTVAFLPNFPAITNSTSSVSTKDVRSSKAFPQSPPISTIVHDCPGLGIQLNLAYTQAWRGFLQSGPGSERSLISARILNMFIAPLYECNVEDSISLVEQLQFDFFVDYFIYPMEEKFYTNAALCRSYIQFGDWISSKINKLEHPSGSRLMRVTMKKVINSENGDVVDGLHASYSRSSVSSMSNQNQQEDYDEDADKGIETDINGEVNHDIHSKFSLKDVDFIVAAITHLRASIRQQILSIPKRDPYCLISKHIEDMRAVPDLKYWLVCTSLDKGLHTDVKELSSTIDNFDVTLHNNTYNLNILNVNISEICLAYSRSLEHLHIASGVYAHINTYNDSLDVWEPVLEPLHVNAIGATDATTLAENKYIGLTTSKIRVEVTADRVECNASQYAITNLIHKLQLNDVVTSSSNRLPPYKIFNQLGVDIYFNIGYNGGVVINNVVSVDSSLPIEISQLVSALNNYKMRKLYHNTAGGGALSNISHSKEYLLWISFINFRDIYESRIPLSIDKVGTNIFDMMKANRNQHVQHHHQSLFAAEVSDETSSSRSSGQPIKFVSEVPLTLLHMSINNNGIRELYLRSILSIKNHTNRMMYVSVKFYGSSAETLLAPGKVYHVPVRYAHPKASLHLKFIDDGMYYEAMSSLGGFIAQGPWGNPLKLRAHLCLCPNDESRAVRAVGSSSSANNAAFMVMLKPEVKHGSILSQSKTHVPVKYPGKENYVKLAGASVSSNNNINCSSSGISSNAKVHITHNILALKPFIIHIQAPVLFCNLLPIPMLYKLASDSNILCAEGCLLPGQTIDVYNLSAMYNNRLYISIRVVNYAWSKWYILCTRSSPYHHTEKHSDITLKPLQFRPLGHHTTADGIPINLPTLDIAIIQKEYLVRFSCQIILNNASNISLYLSESAYPDNFLILQQNVAIGIGNDQQLAPASSTLVRLNSTGTGYSPNDVIAIQDNSDDEEDTSHSTEVTSHNAVSSNTPFMSSNTVNIHVYLPHDHVKCIEVQISSDCTVSQVFLAVKDQLSHSASIVNIQDYLLFYYQANKGMQNNVLADAIADTGDDEVGVVDSQSVAASTTSTPPRGLFRSRSGSRSSEKSSKSVDKTVDPSSVPPNMKYNMSIDLSNENNSISSNTYVYALLSYDIVIVHKAEHAIYTQSKNIVAETLTEGSTGIFNSMFGKSVKVQHLTSFVPYNSAIPYKPHRMLSFHAHVCVKDHITTDWSNTFDLVKTDYDVGDMTILVKSRHLPEQYKSIYSHNHNVFYELGTFVEKGRGLLQHSTMITFVPKRILISKLAYSIFIKQISNEAEFELVAGGISHFHFVDKTKFPLLHARKDQDGSYCGELDISRLGLVYVKLRLISGSICILKVETELIGASFISTFTEQSLIWPPYRIYNNTSLVIRYKQSLDAVISGGNTIASNLAATLSNVHSEEGHTMDVPLDTLKPKQSAGYAWDYPHTGSKLIKLEILPQNTSVNNPNSTSAHVAKDINVYNLYNSSTTETMVIKKTVPNIGNPLAEGHLLLQQGVDSFLKVYCILRTDILYVYEDDSRNILINIIHFSHTVDTSIRYAMVGKYQDSARPQLMGFLNNIIGGGSNTSKYLQNLQYYDVNNVRILMLTLANYMQLFSSLTLELLNKKFARKESESDTGSVNEEVVEAAPTLEEFKIDDAIVSSVTSVTNIFNHEATVLFERRSSADDGRDTVVQQESEINTPISVHLPKNLHSFLANGIGVEQLLDEISVKPILLHDIVTSLLDCNIVENEEEAHLLCECWIAHGFLVKASRIVSSEDISDSKDRNVDATAESDDVDEKALVDSARKESSEANESEDDEADEGFEDDVDDIKDKSDIAPSRERRQSLNYRKEVTKLLSDALKKRYLSAMSGKQNRPVTKTSRLIDEYLDEELFFRPPALCPELAAAMQQHDSKNSSEGADVTAEDDQFGFSLIVPGSKYNFRCASEMEYLGWLQACRQSVELAWKEIILGNKSISNLSVEDFQATVNIKVRADGSTKVIEIVENESSIKKVSQTRGKPHKRSSTSSLLMPLLNRGKRLLRQAGSANSAVEEWSVEAVDKDSELLAVSFSIKAVSLSVIDTAPQEILYLGLNDIHMTVVRYFDAVQFSVTVRNIQVSNQLLNPTFPVLLFARRLKETQSGKLMLPGLNTDLYSDTYTFPTLHLYLKQRYHSINPETGLPLVTDNDQNHQKLWYFDLFTLWLAPLQLAVDEEIIMRVIRYGWGIRNAVMKKTTNSKSLKETGGAVSLQSSKFLQTELDYRDISQYHKQFLQAATSSFESYAYRVKKALNLYFGLLQLHPLDVTLNFRPSPEVQISNAELAAMSIISQLDAARLCLNALIAENAFGSTTIISEIIIKHYRASFWRQFHKLIGATDIVEGSVGLVANIGTGFYDLFYEPIDGLLDSNSSFLNGLSKGGKSLASRAIGGTSAFTSTITGGIGKGVSLLTLDSDFQRNRSLRRFNKTTSVSEGLMVGTQELGKNIMEGVTGIVVAPYKGWESGGGVGLGVGIAKGILGVALKPAVGVFDLASRATEGIRNAAFSSTSDIIVEMKGTYRTRVPRAFGRSGVLLAYDAHAAAAQYMIDSLAGFKADPRMHVIGHLYLVRKVSEDLKNKYHDFSDKNRETSRRRDSNILAILDEEEVSKNVQESWGMSVEKQYLITVGSDRVVLMEILNYSSDDANAGITNTTPTSGNKKKKAVANYRRFVWSCPAQYIDQLYCDNRGDLVLTLSHSVHIASPWNASCPTVLDLQMQNYTLMQSLLEQTVGVKQARLQPLNPWTGFTQSNIRKRYNSGIRSYLLAPTYHTYRLFGSVLYEYSSVSSSKSAAPSGATQSTSVDQPNQPVMTTSSTDSEVVLNSAEFAEKLIRRLFDPVQAKRRDEKSNARRQALLAKIRAQRLAEEEKEAEEVDLAEADAIAIQEQQMRQSLEMALIDDSRSEVSVERVDSVELSEELSTSANDLVSQNDVEENVKALQSSLSAPHGLETIAESEQEDILDDGQVDLNASQMDILRQSVSGDDNSVSNLNVIRRVDKVDSDDEEEDEFENRQTMYSLEDNEDTDGMLLPQDLPEELLSQMQRRHRDSLSTTSPTLLPNLTPFAVQEEIPDNMFLSFIYPLVDLYISGPHIEDNGKQFTIMLARIDGQKMRVLRREDDHGLFIEYKKNSLSLLFDSMDNALRWRHAIEQRIILRAPDALPSGFLTTEERKKAGRSMLPIVGGKNADTSPVIENSILSSLVLPTSDVDPELAELIKIEIARTISETKR